MPELPEVEQVRKTLLPHIKGKTITKVEVYLEMCIRDRYIWIGWSNIHRLSNLSKI